MKNKKHKKGTIYLFCENQNTRFWMGCMKTHMQAPKRKQMHFLMSIYGDFIKLEQLSTTKRKKQLPQK